VRLVRPGIAGESAAGAGDAAGALDGAVDGAGRS